MTNKNIIIVTLLLTIIHFVVTSLIGHYISVQVGTQMGIVVADSLIEANEKFPDKAQEEAARINQNIKTKSDDINERWRIPQLVISLPAKPFITPLLKDMRKQQMNKVIANEITREQFRTQGRMIDSIINILNSLLLGLLVYVGLRFLHRNKPAR
ncbi:MAG: hypothetical protein WA946_09655 [Nitrospirota bacterium]